MKTRLLYLLMLMSYIPVLFAQKSLLISDSTYFSYSDKLAQKPHVWTQIVYNSACLDSVNQVNYPPNPSQSRQVLSSYYPDGKLYRQIQQTYDTTAQAFVTKSRSTYAYNGAGQTQTITNETPNGAGWQPSGIGTFNYDAAGRDTLYLYKTWDYARQAYVNSDETAYGYDAAGRNTLTEYRYWDADASMWIPYFGYYSAYDFRGYQVSYSVGYTNYLTDAYQIVLRLVYYVNSAGLTDSISRVRSEEYVSDSVQYHYTYYPSSRNVKTANSYIYDSSRMYRGGNISTSFYDSSGFSRSDSTLTKSFTTTPDQANPGGSLRLHFYDSASYTARDSTIEKYYTDIPDNATPTASATLVHAYNEYGQTTTFTISQIFYSVFGSASFREDDWRYTLCSSALPVTFLQFTARQKNNDALLQWQALTATEASYFIVQRSTDGIHFTDIGKVATSSGSTRQPYAYTDAGISRLAVPNIWYRLAQQDIGGKITFSNIARLTVASGKLSVSVSPNPVRNTIVIYSTVALPGAVISLTDMNGRLLQTFRQNLAGGATTTIDASQLAKGMYMLVVRSGTDKEVFKIMK